MAARAGRAGAVDLGIAVAGDELLETSPGRVDSAVWLDRAVDVAERRAPSKGWVDRFAYGLGVAVGLPAAVCAGTSLLLRLVGAASPFLGRLTGLWLLKAAFSVSGLARSGRRVQEALEAGDVEAARQALPTSMDSDGENLSSAEVTSAAIESVAEGMIHGFVAPWFYYLLFGVPGALAYRAIHTLRDRWRDGDDSDSLGRAAVRLDDIAGYIPARLSGLLVVGASAVLEEGTEEAEQRMQRERDRVESPGAGWPMSAMAGALGVRLEKRGRHVLGAENPEPQPRDIARAVTLMRTAAALAFVATALLAVLRRSLPSRH